MEDAARHRPEFARVLLRVETKQLVLGNRDTLGCVDQKFDRLGDLSAAVLAVEISIDVALYNTGGANGLEDAAGLEIDDLRRQVRPGSGLLIVNADFRDGPRGCRRRNRGFGAARLPPTFRATRRSLCRSRRRT